MSVKLGYGLTLVLGLTSTGLCYVHYGYGGSVIIVTQPGIGYYNRYYPYNYPYYNSYYPNYGAYYYYPQYRCAVVPRCYPSGDCNYQNQECGYW